MIFARLDSNSVIPKSIGQRKIRFRCLNRAWNFMTRVDEAAVLID